MPSWESKGWLPLLPAQKPSFRAVGSYSGKRPGAPIRRRAALLVADQLHTLIVISENSLMIIAVLSHALATPLAQADAMSPALSGKECTSVAELNREQCAADNLRA